MWKAGLSHQMRMQPCSINRTNLRSINPTICQSKLFCKRSIHIPSLHTSTTYQSINTANIQSIAFNARPFHSLSRSSIQHATSINRSVNRIAIQDVSQSISQTVHQINQHISIIHRSLSILKRFHSTDKDNNDSKHPSDPTDKPSSDQSEQSADNLSADPPVRPTIPVTNDGKLDAELGETMGQTGADLSLDQSKRNQTTNNAINQSMECFSALEINSLGQSFQSDFTRSDLARGFELHPRDMRFLDSSLRNLPSLLARKKVMIVNLELFKAIISADRVLIFDPWYPHVQAIVPLMKHALTVYNTYHSHSIYQSNQEMTSEEEAMENEDDDIDRDEQVINQSKQAALNDMKAEYESQIKKRAGTSNQTNNQSDNQAEQQPGTCNNQSINQPFDPDWVEPRMPFELIALELILMTVCRTLEARFEVYNSSLAPLLSSSSSTLNEGSTLMHLLQLKNGLTSFEVVLRETGQAFRAVLSDDADMSEMNLSAKLAGLTISEDQSNEIEVLLETYLRKVDELENEVKTNVKSISLTEEHIQIRLDTVRNAMMKVELLCTIGTFAVALAAWVASTFGMNLRSGLESDPYAFYIVTATMVTLTVMFVRMGLKLCQRHKIDLFHFEPDEPKLRLPINPYKKSMKRRPHNQSFNQSYNQSYNQSNKQTNNQWMFESPDDQFGSLYGKGFNLNVTDRGSLHQDDWFQQTLEWKLQRLQELKERQQQRAKAVHQRTGDQNNQDQSNNQSSNQSSNQSNNQSNSQSNNQTNEHVKSTKSS